MEAYKLERVNRNDLKKTIYTLLYHFFCSCMTLLGIIVGRCVISPFHHHPSPLPPPPPPDSSKKTLQPKRRRRRKDDDEVSSLEILSDPLHPVHPAAAAGGGDDGGEEEKEEHGASRRGPERCKTYPHPTNNKLIKSNSPG